MPPRRRPMPIVLLLFIRVPLLLPLPLRPSILLLLLLPVVRDTPIPMVGLLLASSRSDSTASAAASAPSSSSDTAAPLPLLLWLPVVAVVAVLIGRQAMAAWSASRVVSMAIGSQSWAFVGSRLPGCDSDCSKLSPLPPTKLYPTALTETSNVLVKQQKLGVRHYRHQFRVRLNVVDG